METIKAFFSKSMYEVLVENNVNVIGVEETPTDNQVLVEISVNNSHELYSLFSAGYNWGEKNRAKVGS